MRFTASPARSGRCVPPVTVRRVGYPLSDEVCRIQGRAMSTVDPVRSNERMDQPSTYAFEEAE